MKQHITPKQLAELSEKGKKRLRKWWKPEEGDLYIRAGSFYVHADGLGFASPNAPNPDYPLLSIGQMVQLIGLEDAWKCVKEALETNKPLYVVLWDKTKEKIDGDA